MKRALPALDWLANWQPGDKVNVPPPQDVNAAEVRMSEGHECVDWYFCKKSL